jgi:biopolymer transport protein ExbB
MLQAIKAFALLGGEWVLFILLGLSLWSIAVIVQKIREFKVRSQGTVDLETQIPGLLAQGDFKQAEKLAQASPSAEGAVLKMGLANLQLDPEALEQVMESQRLQERILMEKNLLVLGTLGNNAPFIGLFGTVLGIIKAFNDLAIAGTSGPTVVMRGVSEALVATAAGLFIAIPAVAAYNYFQSRIKKSLASADRFSRLLLAYSGKKKR